MRDIIRIQSRFFILAVIAALVLGSLSYLTFRDTDRALNLFLWVIVGYFVGACPSLLIGLIPND